MVIHPAIDAVRSDDSSDVTDLMMKTRAAIASALPEELK